MKWYKKDEENLKKRIRSFNSKIARELKKGTDKSLLPEKMSYRELKKDINSRQELNDQLELIKDFTYRGSMKKIKNNTNNEMTLWQHDWMKKKFETDVKIKKQEYRTLINMMKNEEDELKKKQVTALEKKLEKLKDKKFSWNNMSLEEIEMEQDRLFNSDNSFEGRLKKYRHGYLESIRKASTKEEYEEIKKLLNELTDYEIYEQYYLNEDLDTRYQYLQILKFGTGNIKTIRDKWQTVVNKKLGKREGDNIDTRFD
jgi:hypothetical protein